MDGSSDDRGAAGSSAGFGVTVGAAGDALARVSVTGAVDLSTAPAVSDALQRAQQDAPAVLLDLSGVEFLGSAGLSVLVDAARRASESAHRLAIVSAQHAVTHAIEVTGLDAVLQIFDDSAAAETYLRD